MATFYIVREGHTFSVRFSSEDAVNAWSGAIEVLGGSVTRIQRDRSIATVWQTAPRSISHTVQFTGGTPRGFSGDGELFRFDVASVGEDELVAITFSPETAAYLHDGFGTEADVTLEGFSGPAAATPTVDRIDREPPAEFVPVIIRDAATFGDDALLVFETSDALSGVDHYEIRTVTELGVLDWHEAESPYLLHRDVRTVEVKAIDGAGNERVAFVSAAETPPFSAAVLFAAATLFVVGVVVYMVGRVWKTRGHRQ